MLGASLALCISWTLFFLLCIFCFLAQHPSHHRGLPFQQTCPFWGLLGRQSSSSWGTGEGLICREKGCPRLLYTASGQRAPAQMPCLFLPSAPCRTARPVARPLSPLDPSVCAGLSSPSLSIRTKGPCCGYLCLQMSEWTESPGTKRMPASALRA